MPATMLPYWSLPPIWRVTPPRPVEVQEVVGLEHLVAELGVADPLPRSLSRAETESFCIMTLTEKCLPMSRRSSM